MATETVDPTNMLGIKPNVDTDGAPKTPKIHLTERAAKKIRALLEKDGVSPELGGLRVGVQGGGCSGPVLRHASGHASPRPRQNFRRVRSPPSSWIPKVFSISTAPRWSTKKR